MGVAERLDEETAEENGKECEDFAWRTSPCMISNDEGSRSDKAPSWHEKPEPVRLRHINRIPPLRLRA